MKIVLVSAICIFLSCISTKAQEPQPRTASQQSGQSASVQAPTAGTVLSLGEVVKLALAHSPDLSLARAQYVVAKDTAGLDRSAFRPNLYTGSGAAYTNGFPETPGGQPPAVFQMAYNQEIFDKQQRGQQHFDEDLAKNKEIEYQNARENVIVKAASSYLELGDVQHSLQLLQGERDSAQQILDVTREREAAGLELPMSVTQNQLQLAEIQQRIVQYQGREQALSEQLRNMTGLPADEPLHVSSDTTLAAPTMEEASNLVADAVQHSGGLREAENYRLAREESLKGAKGLYWPTVSLIGEYSVLSKINNYQDFFRTFQRNNVTAGISVTIPIFAAKTSAAVAFAKSNLDEANLELAAAKTAVKQGAEHQVQGLKEADAAKEVARLDLQLAQEQLQDSEAKFNQGHLTLGQLEQARVLENEKWLAFLDAGLARERADLNLLQATGQLAKLFP